LPEPQDDVPPIVRKIVEQSTMPLGKAVRELQRRLEALEHRSSLPAIATLPAPTAPPLPAYWSQTAPAPLQRPIGVVAINRSVPSDPDMQALSGRHRRMRALLAVISVLIVVFGGLFGALAASYRQGHH
jgi:hypothetical protein